MPGPGIDLAGEMKRSGLSSICMTFATDYQPGDAYGRFLKALASMDRQLEGNGRSVPSPRRMSAPPIRIAGPRLSRRLEGGHFPQGKIERVEEAYRRGLRHFGLLHDSDASVPLGDVYTNPSRLWRFDRIRNRCHPGMQSAGHAYRACSRQPANHGSRAQGQLRGLSSFPIPALIPSWGAIRTWRA